MKYVDKVSNLSPHVIELMYNSIGDKMIAMEAINQSKFHLDGLYASEVIYNLKLAQYALRCELTVALDRENKLHA